MPLGYCSIINALCMEFEKQHELATKRISGTSGIVTWSHCFAIFFVSTEQNCHGLCCSVMHTPVSNDLLKIECIPLWTKPHSSTTKSHENQPSRSFFLYSHRQTRGGGVGCKHHNV